VLFVDDGGKFGRITVSRLPASAGAPKLLDPKLDAMTAPETESLRESLIESGRRRGRGADRHVADAAAGYRLDSAKQWQPVA
jgi:hypothetical protein